MIIIITIHHWNSLPFRHLEKKKFRLLVIIIIIIIVLIWYHQWYIIGHHHYYNMTNPDFLFYFHHFDFDIPNMIIIIIVCLLFIKGFSSSFLSIVKSEKKLYNGQENFPLQNSIFVINLSIYFSDSTFVNLHQIKKNSKENLHKTIIYIFFSRFVSNDNTIGIVIIIEEFKKKIKLSFVNWFRWDDYNVWIKSLEYGILVEQNCINK